MKITALLMALLLAACSDDSRAPVVATDVTITPPVPGKTMRAGYLSLTNNTNETIRITRVGSDAFASVELHETSIEDGIARMRPLAQLVIEAGDTVRLERGGKHLMLMRPATSAETMTLRFYDGDNLLLSVAAPLTGTD